MTPAEQKISLVDKKWTKYDDTTIFSIGSTVPSVKCLSKVENTGLFDIGILESYLSQLAVCKFCKRGNLCFYQTSFTSGLAKRYFLICDQCATCTDFYTLPKNDISTDYGEKIDFGNNIMQILGGKLHVLGKSGIDALNNVIGLSPTWLLIVSQTHKNIWLSFLRKLPSEVAIVQPNN